MKLKITFLAVVSFTFTAVAQVVPVLQHNNLDNNFAYEDVADMEIYNNEAYFSLPDEGKIVKVSLTNPNAPMVDVLTALSFPTGLSFVGSELYFLQGANATMQNNTGKLCKIDANQTNPTITTLHSTLQFPIELDMNGATAYIAEAHLVDGDLDHMEISAVVGATKTVLYNNFDYLDDVEYYNNKIYMVTFSETSEATTIVTLDVTNNTPGTPVLFWTDTTEIYPYKATISGTKMYLNVDSSPASIAQLDILNPSAPLVIVANQFTYNSNTAYVNEMIVAPGNVLYAIGESYNSTAAEDHYLLYKVDLNLLANKDFGKEATFSAYPNPTTDFVAVANYEYGDKFEVYSLEGKKVTSGSYTGSIDLRHLSAGMYIIKLKSGAVLKICKK